MSRWEDSTFDENPAVDQDEFAPVWEQLQEDLKEDARDTMPELEEFIGNVLRARGIPVDDPVAAGGLEAELVAEWHNLQHAARRVRRGRGDHRRGDRRRHRGRAAPVGEPQADGRPRGPLRGVRRGSR